jgi:hypothetical protein
MNQLEKDLRAARAVIEKSGLCKKRMADETGRHCTVGALYDGAFKKNIAYDPNIELGPRQLVRLVKARRLLEESVPHVLRWLSIFQWNDRPETTKKGVLALYDRAIRKAATL